MLRSLTFLLLIASSAPVFAEETVVETGRTLEERIMKPDVTKEFTFGRSRDNRHNKSFGGKDTNPNFYFVDRVRNKSFKTKESTAGRAFYAGKDKQTQKKTEYNWKPVGKLNTHTAPNINKTLTQEQYRVSESRFGQQQVATRSYPKAREIKLEGTAQGSIDQQYGSKAPITLDRVKEILNRNQ